MSFLHRFMLAVFSLGVACSLARGDGLIIVHDGPEVPNHFRFAPLEVTYHRVVVKIDDLVAVTTIDQEFYNPNDQRLEGTYVFPLPIGATIDKFAMDVNGKMTEAELLDAAKARAIYEDIVRRQRDPALLEYVGRGAFKARIFPIDPHSKKQVRISYTQLLKSDSSVVEYVYPLNTGKFSSKPLNDVSVKVELNTTEPIKSVYCPSHTVEIRRDGAKRAVIGFEAKNARPDTDFKLIFSRTEKPVGVDLLSYRAGGEGYFVLLASPGLNAEGTPLQQRDVCFVLDTSGSMAGPKMEQAKRAILFCLANLNDGDRFEIVRFSTEAEPFFGKLEPATKDNIDRAMKFVNGLKPIGGTAIQDALSRAMNVAGRVVNRPYVVIFLTDGQPTIGETNEDALVSIVTEKAKGAKDDMTRIFCFGIGTDINTILLDRVSQETGGFGQYVMPEEDIEIKVSNFYTKIRHPVLSNVQVIVEGDVRVSQVYPKVIADLYKGDQLTIFGRYSGHGPAAVRIRGTLNGEVREFVTDVHFTESDIRQTFIPRLWATRRVGWLLDEIRLRGESAELKEEIVKLAREHGIVTPYTAFLIVEDEQRRNVPLAERSLREFEELGDASGAKSIYDSAAEPGAQKARTGEQGIANSEKLQLLKESDNEEQSTQNDSLGRADYDDRAAGYRAKQDFTQQTRVVNGRAFYQNGQTWTDSRVQSNQELPRQEVAFNSEAYFELMKQHPEIAAWLSLGQQVDLVIGKTVFVIR